METLLRSARIEDAAALADLVRVLDVNPHLREEPREATQARIARHLSQALASPSHTILVAENPILVGYVAIHWLPYLILQGAEGFVSELFVHPEARGQGLGTRLLTAARNEAEARGCARLGLLNMRTRESYRRGFYRAQGWMERADAANFILQVNP